MRRTWLSIAWTVACIMSGLSTTTLGQQSGCDTVEGTCPSRCQQRQRLGVRIPSLQFLVVDRLSAAGDRFQNNVNRGSSCTHACCSHSSPVVYYKHASCGVELCPIQEPSSHPVASGRITDSKYADSGSEHNRIDANASTQGSLNDQPSSTALVPVPPSVPINTPRSNPEFAVPKLLPTPVSEPLSSDSSSAIEATPSASASEHPEFPKPIDEPTSTDTPEVSENLPEVDSIPGVGPLPSDGKQLPPPHADPLPDILVDPFIDDVGQSKSSPGVTLAGGTVPAPSNALRGAEPKRLKKGKREATPSDPEAPKPTRIIIKRSIERKISQ